MIETPGKKTFYIAGIFVLALICSSCKQGVLQNDSDLPATLVDTTAQTRSELNQVVSLALLGVDVTLADDALTKTSLLVIERRKPQNISSDRIMGRDLSTPDQFRLVTNGGQCILVHQKNGKRYLLSLASCKKN